MHLDYNSVLLVSPGIFVSIFSEVKAAAGSGTSAIFKIGDVRFVIKQGDITQEAADAIVNSSNSQLDLSRG